MRSFHYTVFLLLATIYLGCDPYRFSIESPHGVDCRIFSDHNSVSSHLYGFNLYPNATLHVTSLGKTQFELGSYMTLKGEGFQILLRPVAEESVIDSGLVLTFSNSGMRLDSAGQKLDENRSFRFPKDSATYVNIYNEEAFLQVTVGCDTVVKRFSNRKSSDDIVLKTFPESELKVNATDWKPIKFDQEYNVVSEKRR